MTLGTNIRRLFGHVPVWSMVQSRWKGKGMSGFPLLKLQGMLRRLGWIVFSIYVVGLVSMVSRRASTLPVALAESSDLGNAMVVLNRTHWNSDNEWRFYGPLYYRLARSLLSIDPIERVGNKVDVNARDKAAHLALMLTSLFALILLAVVVGAQVGPDWTLGWLAGLFVFAFLSSSELWVDFTVDAHPDILLSLLVAVATTLSIRSLRPLSQGQPRFLWVVGAAWGLALLTKMSSATFFVGALVPLLAAAWLGRCVVRAGLFVGLGVLLSYSVVGFPQSLKVREVWSSMLYVASATVKTFEWVFWKNMLFETSVLPLLSLVGVALMFVGDGNKTEDGEDLPWGFLSLGFMIPGLAFVALFGLSYQDHMRHYILPVTSALLVTSIPLIRRGALSTLHRLPTPLKPCLRVVGFLLTVVVVIKGSHWYHEQSTLRVTARFPLQEEAGLIQKVVSDDLDDGKYIVADSFVPFDYRKHEVTTPPFGLTANLLGQLSDADVFVSSRWYHERFLKAVASPWTLLKISEEDYRQRFDFYTQIDKDSFVDGSGRLWKLRLRTPLGWAVWDLSEGTSPLSEAEKYQMIRIRDSFLSDVLLDLDFSHSLNRGGQTILKSKSGQEIAVEGPVEFVPGPRAGQKALVVQSTPPFTRLTPSPAFLSLDRGTFSVWARTTDPRKTSSILLSANTVVGAPRSLYLDRGSSGKFSVLFNGQALAAVDAVVRSKKWNHYVLTWDNKGQCFYLNGRLVGTSFTRAISTECRTFSLGWLGDNNDESQWPGPLAEVVTLKRSLSAQEVNALYRIGIRGRQSVSKN